MSVNDAYAFYGSSIDCVYYSTTGYKHVTLVPSSNHYSYSLQLNPEIYGEDIPTWLNTSNLNYVVYYAVVNDFSNNPSYLGISINPNVNFSDCTALRFCAASYLGSYTTSSQAYDESFIKLYGATELRYTNTPYIKDNIFPYMYILRGNNSRFRVQPVWCDYSSDTLSTVSMMQVGFNGCHLDGNEIDVYLSCPLVNDTAVPGTGIVTGTSSPSGGSSADLTETNGLISSVISAITNLPNTIMQGLHNLFIPDDDFMDEFKDDMQDLLEDHLGGLYEAVTLLTDMFDDLPSVTAKQSIYIPACHIPLAGVDFVLGDWTVPLKVSGLPNIFYEGIAFITDFLATMAFLNMCRRKLEIFLNPDSEVIQS